VYETRQTLVAKLLDTVRQHSRSRSLAPAEEAEVTELDWCAQHDDIPELVTLATTISMTVAASILDGEP